MTPPATIGVAWKVAATPLWYVHLGTRLATLCVSMAASGEKRCPPRSWPCSDHEPSSRGVVPGKAAQAAISSSGARRASDAMPRRKPDRASTATRATSCHALVSAGWRRGGQAPGGRCSIRAARRPAATTAARRCARPCAVPRRGAAPRSASARARHRLALLRLQQPSAARDAAPASSTRSAAPACSAQLRGLGEVEGVRAHHHRAAAGRGLDQVLPAERREAAAEQRDVGAARSTAPSRPSSRRARRRRRRIAGGASAQRAAPRDARSPRCAQQRGDLVEALRMARHDRAAAARGTCALRAPGGEQQRLLAFARARDQHDRRGRAPRARPGRASAAPASGVMSNFRLPQTSTSRRAGCAQPRGIVLGLRPARARALRPPARISAASRCAAAQRLCSRQPRIGQHHRHAARLRRGEQVRPHLGLHQHADARAEVLEEARARPPACPTAARPAVAAVAQQRAARPRGRSPCRA